MKSNPRAYVVDDDPAVVEALASLIGIMGYDVNSFTSAEEFLQAYRPGSPECLILDVRLPGMSGLELQRELRRRGSRLPIVFITGHADQSAAVEAMEQGAVEFLEKPFQTRVLLECVEKAVALDEENRVDGSNLTDPGPSASL
ncbi:MAG: response regulator transcription factor [Pirellulales bacterium]|nr:response regulator transcription factor [Pirellulales bacterium]